MIVFSGYGLFIVMVIYGVCFFAMSKLLANATELQQIIALGVTITLATALSYGAARLLNKNGVKHTLFDLKLQTSVLIIGGLMLALWLFMFWGSF